jgi:hypothetical protein
MNHDLTLLTLAAKCGALQYGCIRALALLQDGDATDTDAARVVKLLEEILKGSDHAMGN